MDNQNNNQYNYNPQPPQNVPGKSQATVSLVCGIVSLVLCWLGWAAIVALALGIVGIVCSVKAKKLLPKGHTGLATAGLVCSIIGLCLSGIMTVCVIVAGGIVGCAACTSDLIY